MIMAARHHFAGSGCIPHTVTMTRRWGPVGFMRVGGLGLRSLGMGQPSPVGFADFASYQGAVIASFPPCPPPIDATCENPRDAAISAALNQWATNPQSCHNIVCNSAGQPQISIAPSGSGSGYNTTGGFVPVTSQVSPQASTQTAVSPRPTRVVPKPYVPPPRHVLPKPYAPPQPSVVNPSPPSQLTTTGSSTTAPGSAVSQANGTVAIPGTTASTVGGTVSTTDTSGDIVSGLPNWMLFAGAGIVIFLLAKVK